MSLLALKAPKNFLAAHMQRIKSQLIVVIQQTQFSTQNILHQAIKQLQTVVKQDISFQ